MKYWTTLQKLMWLKRASGGSQEYSGDIVQFTTPTAKKLKNLIVSLSPIQDLHGYEAPWAGGAGKNKIDGQDVSAIASVDDQYNITADAITLQAGTYTLSFTVGTTVTATRNRPMYIIGADYVYANNDYKTAGRWSWTFTISEETSLQLSWWGHTLSENCTISDFMLESGSTATSFAPYENLCPITGRTGASAYLGAEYDPDTATLYSVQFTDGDDPLTVYSGTIDLVTGDGVVDSVKWVKNTATMDNAEQCPGWKASGIRDIIGGEKNEAYTNRIMNIGSAFAVNTTLSYDILYLPTARYGKSQTEWQALAIDVEIVVPLATPISFYVEPQQIMSLAGENVVWSADGPVTVRV